MTVFVIGSEALRANKIAVIRPKLDIDFIATQDFADNIIAYAIDQGIFGALKSMKPTRTGIAAIFDRRVLEFELVDRSPLVAEQAAEIGRNGCTAVYNFWGMKIPAASPEFVYTLKMSHRYLKNSPSFMKTMDDIHLLRNTGHGVIVDEDFYRARMAATYDYGHPNLNVKKGEFFKPDVPYVYDHDTIHEAVAVMDRPAYTFYMKDGAQVMTDKEKFFSLPREVQLLGVLEESYVLALERSIIPHNSDRRRAFTMAISKVCTSITSGWFREFAWENYHDVVALYNDDFVEKFRAALAAGRIKPFQGSHYG